MKDPQRSVKIELLGDQGALARFLDEGDALRWAEAARGIEAGFLLDVVQAYATVAVYHDPRRISLAQLVERLGRLDASGSEADAGRAHLIPCCYELGPDLGRVAAHAGLGVEEVIRLHGSLEYRVYAIGFSPGFPYLGYLPEALCGVPRLESPRLHVEPGSIGLTGRQTGIYPEARPGGWCLVGRTPLVLVDVVEGYFPLRTGDRVRFGRIDESEFGRLKGERL
jgi:inhibitor of KinA